MDRRQFVTRQYVTDPNLCGEADCICEDPVAENMVHQCKTIALHLVLVALMAFVLAAVYPFVEHTRMKAAVFRNIKASNIGCGPVKTNDGMATEHNSPFGNDNKSNCPHQFSATGLANTEGRRKKNHHC